MATTEAALRVVEDEDAPAFGEVRIPSHFLIKQGDRDYLLSDGLLIGLEQLSRGHYDLETQIVQLPTADNGQLAVVRCTVVVFDPVSGATLRRATGTGDASPGNVGRMVAPHVLRMAETRSVARACRHILGLGVTALEELADDGDTPRAPQTRPDGRDGAGGSANRVPPTEHIVVGDRTYSREEVTAAYRRRLVQATEAGLAVQAPAEEELARAPLSVIVGQSQSLKRRLEEKGSSGK